MIISKFSEIIYLFASSGLYMYDLFLILSLELLFCDSVHIRERKGDVLGKVNLVNLWERPARDLGAFLGFQVFLAFAPSLVLSKSGIVTKVFFRT